MSALLLDLLAAAAILAGGYVLSGLVESAARTALRRSKLDPLVQTLVTGWVRPLVIFAAALAALKHLGVDLTSLVAVLGAATLAVGLALQASLSNVAAGAILLSTDPYDGGDSVLIGGQSGTILKMTLLHTVLKSADGPIITLPNAKVLAEPITNFTRNGQRRVDIDVVVPHEADVAKATAALLGVVSDDARALAEPAPTVTALEVAPHGLKLRLSVWTLNESFGALKSDATAGAVAALRKSRIGVASTVPVLPG